jgi:hypothetical protein
MAYQLARVRRTLLGRLAPLFARITRSPKTVEVVGECHRPRIDTRDNSQRFGFMAERAQHAMREHDLLDFCNVGDASNHGRRHVQLPRSAGFALGDCVVRHEYIRVLCEQLEIAIVSVAIAGEHDALTVHADAPAERRHAAMHHASRGGFKVSCEHERTHFMFAQRNIVRLQRIPPVPSAEEVSEIAVDAPLTVEEGRNKLCG